jgi:hypothetical protein
MGGSRTPQVCGWAAHDGNIVFVGKREIDMIQGGSGGNKVD